MLFNRKKVLITIAASAAAIVFSSCSGGGLSSPTPVPTFVPTELVTAQDLASITGYPLVADGDVKTEGNTHTITYKSDPVGKDSVTISITQSGANLSKDEVQKKFEDGKTKRATQPVKGIGTDAYIAYPFISIYDRGCYVRIAAGSCSDSKQSDLLQKIGKKVTEKIESTLKDDTQAQNVQQK